MPARMTVDLADDLKAQLDRMARERGVRFKDVVNETMRLGLRDIAIEAKSRKPAGNDDTRKKGGSLSTSKRDTRNG
jgi:hypothetical protein